MRFGLFARGDVADRGRYQDAFGAFERAQHDLDGKLALVLAPPGELNPRADLLRQRLGRRSQTVRDQPFREAFRNDVLHLLPDQLIAVISELLLRLNVQQDDLPALVHHHHGIRSRLQQAPILAFHLCQVLFDMLAHYERPIASGERDSARLDLFAQGIIGNPVYRLEIFFIVACGLVRVLLSLPFSLSSVMESLALNGYRRVDCCPVVLREMSTRRLLAQTIVCRLLSISRRSSSLKSGFCSISCFTCEASRFSSLPNDRVSMFPAGTPCSIRNLLVRST